MKQQIGSPPEKIVGPLISPLTLVYTDDHMGAPRALGLASVIYLLSVSALGLHNMVTWQMFKVGGMWS